MGGKKDLWEDCDCLKRIEKELAPRSIPLNPDSVKRVSEELARELAKKKNKA